MYFCSIFTFASTLFFLSCQKENQTSNIQASIPKALLAASSRTVNPFMDNRIQLENGMLVFSNYKAFKDIHEGLKEMNSNSDLNHNTLVEMGYNADSDDDAELAVIPEYPVLKAFANRFQLITEEQKEDAAYKQYLNTLVGEDVYEGSCVYDPTLQAMLNDKRELGIGNFIVKFISLNKIALIYNKNLEVLENVRNTEVGLLKNGIDLKILDVEDAVVGANDIFSGEGDSQELTGGNCDLALTVESMGGDKFKFSQLGALVTPKFCSEKYEWDFGDGVVVKNNQLIMEHDFVGKNYPYTVKFTVLCGDCASKTTSIIVTGTPCDKLLDVDFTAIQVGGGNEVQFKTTGLSFGMTGTYDFGDPGANPGIVTFATPNRTHFYPSVNDPFTFIVTLTVSTGSCTPVVITKTIRLSCGNHFAKRTREDNGVFNGKEWYLKGAIWLQDNIFTHETGSSSKVKRGKFTKKANFISTDLQGIVTSTSFNTSPATCTDVTIFPDANSNTNDSYIDRRPAHSKNAGFRDNELFSTHKATIGTGAGALPLEIDKLYLIN